MTKRTINKDIDIEDKNFKKLSIQVSLNGLSFCIVDTISHKVLSSENEVFTEELSPSTLLDEVKGLLQKHGLNTKSFDEVVVVHTNNLFSLVPKPLFKEDSLRDYLKFNTKILATDVLAFDELVNLDMMNIYVPYMNVNNYIYDLFGEFTFLHNGTVLIQSLLDRYSNQGQPQCFVYVGKKQMDVVVINQKKLAFYNSFIYETAEDFCYYLLFVMEQLELNTDSTSVKFFGQIEEDDEVFKLCYSYIKELSVFMPASPNHLDLGEPDSSSIDFTVLSTL